VWLCAASDLGPAAPVELTGDAYVLGRCTTCDIVLSDASVSRRHARLMREGESLRVEDLQSRNGTLVNGQPVKSALVVAGDQLLLGAVSLLLASSPLTPSQAALEMASTAPLRYQPAALKSFTTALTPTQSRVLRLLLDGLDEKAIGARFNSSPRTVHNHIQAIYRALAVNSRQELLVRLLGQQPFDN
jgi:DNA-binding CsgD family transcriptional regulator